MYSQADVDRARAYLEDRGDSYLLAFANRLRSKLPPITLSRFVEKTSNIKCEPWQSKLCDRLQLLPQQKGQRILIHKPPQTGGSIILSQRLAPYVIGCNPNARIRLITFNETHSARFSEVMLSIMASNAYREIFANPFGWPHDRAAVGEWSTPERQSHKDGQASFIGMGLLSGIVGTGGDLWIIDDPYKNRDDAFSSTINDKVWWGWKENITPRLAPNDNVICMFHRWHEDDFAGRLEADGGWEKIRIPSICDEEPDFAGRRIGDILTPRQPLDHLMRLRDGYVNEAGVEVAGCGEAVFESLHQGNPKVRGGTIFKLEDFKLVKEFQRVPDSFMISYWDIGNSESLDSDRTSNWLLYKTPGQIYTFLDHSAFRLRKSERNNRIYNTEKLHRDKYSQLGPIISYVEYQFGSGVDTADEIARQCGEWGMRQDHVNKRIEERADPLAVQMQNGNVRFLGAPWNKEAQDEFLSFPQGKHDDRVSSAAGAYNCAAAFRML